MGCADLSQWNSYRDSLPTLVLDSFDEIELKDRLRQDVKSLYFKGCYSLLRGLADMDAGHYSWAIIKFYYAIFYYLRSSLGSKNIAYIKCKSPFVLKTHAGQAPVKKGGNKFRNDHSAMIAIWIEEDNDNDILLTNNIEEIVTYTWMQEQRNKIQYRKSTFEEPVADEALIAVTSPNLSYWIESILDDEIDHFYCFDPDYAALALPLKRSLFSSIDLVNAAIELDDEQKSYLRTIAPSYEIFGEVLDSLNL